MITMSGAAGNNKITYLFFALALAALLIAAIACFSSRHNIIPDNTKAVTDAIEKTDKVNIEIDKLLGELNALKESRMEVADRAKEQAINSIDAISGDHNAVIGVWESRVREFRNRMGTSGDNPN